MERPGSVWRSGGNRGSQGARQAGRRVFEVRCRDRHAAASRSRRHQAGRERDLPGRGAAQRFAVAGTQFGAGQAGAGVGTIAARHAAADMGLAFFMTGFMTGRRNLVEFGVHGVMAQGRAGGCSKRSPDTGRKHQRNRQQQATGDKKQALGEYPGHRISIPVCAGRPRPMQVGPLNR